MTECDYRIQEFDQGTTYAGDVSALHDRLLNHSPLVLMGPEFMKEFYYTILPAEGLICGAVAYVNGRPVGFIVGTDDASGFMSRAVRNHWLRLCWIMIKGLIRNPGRILAVKEAWLIQHNVQALDYGPEVGELLSFGVLPEYRSRNFMREKDLHISEDLLQTAIGQLRSRGMKTIRAIVDKDNLPAQLFYRAHGWRVGLKSVDGWRVPTMEFVVNID